MQYFYLCAVAFVNCYICVVFVLYLSYIGVVFYLYLLLATLGHLTTDPAASPVLYSYCICLIFVLYLYCICLIFVLYLYLSYICVVFVFVLYWCCICISSAGNIRSPHHRSCSFFCPWLRLTYGLRHLWNGWRW